MMKEHAELRSELDARDDVYKSLCDEGKRLLQDQAGSASTVAAQLEDLCRGHEQLYASWEDGWHAMELQKDALKFEQESLLAEKWLESCVALIGSGEDAGVDDPDLLLKVAEPGSACLGPGLVLLTVVGLCADGLHLLEAKGD
jgi:hypothetical protein